MVEDQRHDRLHPLRQRRIGGAHELLVVLDEVDAGVDQLAHHRGRLRRSQAKRRLDDRADDRAILDAGQPAAAGYAESWAGMIAFELGRQLHVDDADSREAPDRIGAADRDRHQRREIGADGVEREADLDIGALEGPDASRGDRGPLSGGQMPDRQDARRHPCLQFLGFARQSDERAGRLVACDFGSQRLDAARGLDAIGEGDHGRPPD